MAVATFTLRVISIWCSGQDEIEFMRAAELKHCAKWSIHAATCEKPVDEKSVQDRPGQHGPFCCPRLQRRVVNKSNKTKSGNMTHRLRTLSKVDVPLLCSIAVACEKVKRGGSPWITCSRLGNQYVFWALTYRSYCPNTNWRGCCNKNPIWQKVAK